MNRYILQHFSARNVTFTVGIIGTLFFMAPAANAATCTFDRDLQMGIVGEDVRCLQQYLNASGFVVTTTGGGAPGKETTEFKTLTEAALIKWQQANKLSPASGYFGPRSQQVYKTLISGVGVIKPLSTSTLAAGVDISQDALLKKVAELKAQLSGTVITTTEGSTTLAITSSLTKQLKDVTKSLRDAEEEVADNDDADDYDDAVDSLAAARDDFYKAVLAYIAGNAALAAEALDDVENSIADALDAVNDKGADAEADLDDARDELDNVRDEVDAAEDDGEDMDDAQDYLDEAEDLLDEAEDAIDDEDYDEAADLIDEALDLIADAEDEL